MQVNEFLSTLINNPSDIKFADTIAVIDTHYTFTATAFRNGELQNDAWYRWCLTWRNGWHASWRNATTTLTYFKPTTSVNHAGGVAFFCTHLMMICSA